MKPNLTTVFKPDLVKANNNQEQIKNIQEDVANLTPKIDEQKENDFFEILGVKHVGDKPLQEIRHPRTIDFNGLTIINFSMNSII